MNKAVILMLLILAGCATQKTQNFEEKQPEIKLATIDREGIRKTFYKHQRYIRQCYQKTLTANPDKKMNGMVTLNFDIDASGKGKSPSVVEKKTTLNDSKLHQCLYAGISSWDWPVARNGQVVNVIYPLKFNDAPPNDMQKKLDRFKNIRRE